MSCFAANPIVNGIEKDLKSKAKVVRLNMLSALGREVAARYDVRSVPTVIVLDGANGVVYRHAGLPDRRAIVAQLA